MKDEQETFDQIEQYLQGKMTGEEKIVFERKIAQDKLMSERVKSAKETDEAILIACLGELKKNVRQDLKKIKYTPDSSYNQSAYFFFALGLFICGGIVYWVTQKSHFHEIPASVMKARDGSGISVERSTNTLQTPAITYQKEKPTQPIVLHKNNVSTLPIQKEEVASVKKIDLSILESIHQNEKIHHSPFLTEIRKDSTEINTTPSIISETTDCNTTFDIKTEPSCQHKETGKITILTDGTTGFNFQVNDLSTQGSSGEFHHLPPGEHKVVIAYNKECIYTKVITIKEKWCPMNNGYSFNPDFEKWDLKYAPGANGTYTILNNSGKEIFSNTFGTGNESWNGTDQHGVLVYAGSYICIVLYSDGRKEKVELTIVR